MVARAALALALYRCAVGAITLLRSALLPPDLPAVLNIPLALVVMLGLIAAWLARRS